MKNYLILIYKKVFLQKPMTLFHIETQLAIHQKTLTFKHLTIPHELKNHYL
jgi:hypothetical protein